MTALLYQLLRLALRCPSPQAELRIQIHSLSEKSWYRLFSISREQAVSALVFDAIGLLGCEESIPDSLAMRWMLEVQSIQDRACTVNRLAHELCASLETSGVHPILFKGPAVASCYPQPTLRTSGDIDLYFSPQEFKKARLFLASHLAPETTAPDGSFHYRLQDIDVDLHTRYYDFPCNEKLLPPVPSAPATLLMLSSHILKHALGPGVGLRQVCDLAMACRALKGEYNPEEMVQWFRVTNTYRWNRMLFSLIKERFELDAGLFPPGEHSSYAPLEAIIFSGGNFGHHAPSRRKALNSSARRRKWDTALRMMQRLPFALRYAPRQYVFYFSSLLKGNLESNTTMSQITPTRYVLREQAIALYQEGKGYKAIASALGLSRDTIRNWIVSYRNTIGRSEYLSATGNLLKTPSYLKREERFALVREEYENCSASLLSIAKKHELNYSNLRNHILRDHPESSLLHAYAKQSDKMNAAIDDQIAAIRQIGEEYLAQMREELDNQIQRLQSP